MNQKQREFLIKKVENVHTRQARDLKKPQRPSFSNYIIAAVLDGSVRLKKSEELYATIKDRVLNMSSNDNSMFNTKSRRWNDDDDEDDIFEINAKDMFEEPEGHKIAWKEYQDKMDAYNKAVLDLDSTKDTLIMKIQIGSDKVLDRLIEEADNLADLSLMNEQLTLKSGPSKQLKN